MADEPNIDDGLSAEQLKAKFDEPAEKTQTAMNNLMSELENVSSASLIGASKIKDTDTTINNVQSKLNSLQEQITTINETNITTNKIENGAITTDKLADSNVTTPKIADSSITTRKVENGSITSEKIEESVKKAENITATSLSTQDTSEANVQAKLNKLYTDLIGISQGGVADNSITTSKIVNNSVTKEKIDFGLFLVPSGFIGMWSGTDVPEGWYLCDGTNGTPDLRDRFIVSSGNSYATGDTGGSNSVVLTTDQMPSHNHNVAMSGEATFKTGGYGSYGSKDNVVSITEETNKYWYTSTASISGSCTCEETGGGKAHENRPPYYALAFIMKA